MAILRSTQVQGKLEVIDNDLYVTGSGSLIHGNLAGKASVAEGLDPTKDIVIGSTEATHSLTVNGDLKVTGDVVYTGTENLRVKDKNIDLNVDDKGNAASDRAGANGAGITVRATSATGQNEDVTLVYDDTKKAWTSNVPFDVAVEGTVDRAKTAETASKVAHTLSNGTGISTFTFDGSAEATVSVDDAYIQGIKVTNAKNADNATTAGTASKTVGKLTAAGDVEFIGAGGEPVTEFDGSKNVTVKVDLTDVTDSVTAVTGKVTTLEAKVDANKTATDSALQGLEGKIDKKVSSVNPGSAINVTGTTTTPTVSVKLAETQGNVQLDVTDGLKANLSADAALSTTSENPVQNKVVTRKINALWDQAFPVSLNATISGGNYEFDGKTHNVTVGYKIINGTVEGTTITDVTIAGTSVGTGATGNRVIEKTNQGTTYYEVKAVVNGTSYTESVHADAWLPSFAAIVAVDDVANLTLADLKNQGKSIKKTFKLQNPKGSSETPHYTWFCVPSGQTISKVTSGGFDVPINAAVAKKFTIGGQEFTYSCYRTDGDVTPASVIYVCS